MKAKCSRDNCENISHARGLCHKHWDEERGVIPWHKANPDKQRERVAKWRAKNKEKMKDINKRSHENNREKRIAYNREYRKNNLEHMRMLGREWSKNNPEKYKVTNASRRSKKKNATPVWSDTEFETFVIKEIYDLSISRSKLTGIQWHVDHIVPLKSDLVCGLHCSANLQVIPATVNHSKGNRVWPNMP